MNFTAERKLAFCTHRTAEIQAQASYCVLRSEQLIHNNSVLGTLGESSVPYNEERTHFGSGLFYSDKAGTGSDVALKTLSRSHTH